MKLVGWSLVAAGLVMGCHKNSKSTLPAGTTTAGISGVDPTLCDTAGKNIITGDLNKDGKPDVWRLYKTEDEGGTKVEFMTCKQVDFDYDGKWDMSTVYDTKSLTVAEIERDTDFDGKFDVKELYDGQGHLTSVRRDRNNDGQPDLWEQYKDTVLLAILYDDNFDGKVDRREEIPGARPKVEMPTTVEPTASGTLAPTTPAPATKPKTK